MCVCIHKFIPFHKDIKGDNSICWHTEYMHLYELIVIQKKAILTYNFLRIVSLT